MVIRVCLIAFVMLQCTNVDILRLFVPYTMMFHKAITTKPGYNVDKASLNGLGADGQVEDLLDIANEERKELGYNAH